MFGSAPQPCHTRNDLLTHKLRERVQKAAEYPGRVYIFSTDFPWVTWEVPELRKLQAQP